MADLLGTLGNIGEIVQGADRAGYNDALRRLALQQLQQRQLQQQQLQQQQQAMGLAAGGLAGLAQGGGQAPQPNPMPQPQGLQGLAQQPQQAPALASLTAPNLAGSGVDWKDESPLFKSRVSDLVNAMPSDVRAASSVDSGYRTNQQQADIYQRSGQGTKFAAAPPGKSLHEQGLAADWTFGSPAADQWTHQNAGRFGLGFPLGSRDPNHMQLAADVQQKSVVMAKAGVPQPAVQETAQAALGTIPQLDPTQFGKSTLTQLWQAVDKAQPDADPVAKFLAVGMLQKMMAPGDQMAFKLYAQQNQEALKIGMLEFRAQEAERGRFEATARAAMIEGMKEAFKGSQTGGKNAPIADVAVPDKWEGMPDKPPPNSGISQATWAATLTYVQTGKMPAMGMAAGGRQQILAAAPAAQQALGIKPSEVATGQAEFHGLMAGESTLGRRLANLTTSIDEAAKAAPAVIDTSKGVPRTEFPAANQFNQWLQVQTGDPNIIRFKGALNTFLNIYAKGINPTGQMTDQQQRHAYETLSTALSQGQIEAGVDQLTKELGYAKEGLSQASGELKGMFQQHPAPAAAPTSAAPDFSGMSREQIQQQLAPENWGKLTPEQQSAIAQRVEQLSQ